MRWNGCKIKRSNMHIIRTERTAKIWRGVESFLFIIAIRKLVHCVFLLAIGLALVMLSERVQRPYLDVCIKCPGSLHSAGRWWCDEWPHEGVGVSNEGDLVSIRSSFEGFPYRGHIQVVV